MDFLKSIFGDPVPDAVSLILITLALVVILVLVIWLVRKFVGSPALKAARGRRPRLAVTDAATLDDKRRLVLVRRDNVEHLVMIGGASDVLLETGIVRNSPVNQAPAKPQELETKPSEPDNKEILIARAGAAGVAAVASTISSSSTNTSVVTPVAETKAPNAASATQDSTDNFGDQLSELSRNLEDVVADSPEEIVEETVDAISDTTENMEAAVSEVAQEITDVEASAAETTNDLQSIVEDSVTSDTVEPEVELELSGLEDALGEELSDIAAEPLVETSEDIAPEPKIETLSPAPEVASPALQKEQISNEETVEVATEEAKPDADDMEDEMQKLLDELSGEKV